MKTDVYQIVTDRLISALEAGTAPWRKPWSDGGAPRNAITGREYSGINYFLLSAHGGARFLTYRQAQEAGGNVRKGEKGCPVIYWNFQEVEGKDGKEKKIPFARYFTVFSIDQCESLDLPTVESTCRHHSPIPEADAVIQRTGARIRHGGFRAFYRPSSDEITLPEMGAFHAPEEYYQTAIHELAHWTGHPSRLNREGISSVAAFGSAVYSREELVAEMAASFVCGKIGLEIDTENSAAYLRGWIAALRGDARLAVRAASAASKAAAFIMGDDPAE